MKTHYLAGLLMLLAGAAMARPQVEVNVPPEVFSTQGQQTQRCTQCCVYQNENYSEGAVINTDGGLLQCLRDEKTIGTNPLIWRRVK
ncbi:DUF1496 domain-containing protein [Pseudocitrobacter cyperus]|uniref:DUF1496 domain-containing protein n=1 Tax=Pseudocitrobacter cyperus TaxID=3112843 RepID=A0ABV0HF94_9ENTR